MPTPTGAAAGLHWPDYADSEVAGICRSVTSGEFKRQTQKNAALRLEVPRLKRGRFCRSSESLDILAGARLTIAIVDRTES